jgi:hypothetical protein
MKTRVSDLLGCALLLLTACSARHDTPQSPPQAKKPASLAVLCSTKDGDSDFYADNPGRMNVSCSADGPLVARTSFECRKGTPRAQMLVGHHAQVYCDEGGQDAPTPPVIPQVAEGTPSALTVVCSTGTAATDLDHSTGKLRIRCPANAPLVSTTLLECRRGRLKSNIEGGERVTVLCADGGGKHL